jgi:hypothetical protein
VNIYALDTEETLINSIESALCLIPVIIINPM